MVFLKENWEGIVALLAMLATAVSSYFTYKTFNLQRIHNTKSVRPILHIGQWDYENRITVDLRNQGPGVGIVKNIRVCKNDTDVKTCIFHWLPEKLPGDMNYKEYWTGYKDFTIKAGEICKLIELPIDTTKPEEVTARETIRGILRQLTIEIDYEDIYDNKIPKLTKSLILFARTDHEN
ncbi:hypothetical protein GCM10027578_35590 [Spirosoma luteolum]